ncbi:MAG: sulfotransferase [Pseudomonadota bacterium]
MSRIFVIGLNKCGTNSLHQLFVRSGLSSLHFRAPDVGNAAVRLVNNICAGRPCLFGMDRYQAYSDLSYADAKLYIEGAHFFRHFHAEYPDAWFILNTRDEAAWLDSRLSHRNGTLRARAMKIYGVDEAGLRTLWETQFRSHNAAVRQHFADAGRFLEFRIDQDPAERLANFLHPDFDIDVKHWRQRNRSPATASTGHSDGARQHLTQATR